MKLYTVNLPIFYLKKTYIACFEEKLWNNYINNLLNFINQSLLFDYKYFLIIINICNNFIIHDGPPYLNGVAHIGHIFNKLLNIHYIDI